MLKCQCQNIFSFISFYISPNELLRKKCSIWIKRNFFLRIFRKFKIVFSCDRPLPLITRITCSKWLRDSCLSRRFRNLTWPLVHINTYVVLTKSGNAPFRHFQLNVDNSEAKFSLVFKSDKLRPKSRVLEPTSRLTSNRGRLVRMVGQNGGKFERL